MAPKRKVKRGEAAPAISRRRTRSVTAGKRAAPPPAPPKAKKKIRFADESVGEAKSEEKKTGVTGEGESKSFVIEACKQCNSFKTRAIKVKEGLETAIPGITVTINPDKPRRGCFEIREDGGEIFISLLNMPRPFKPMKALDMDQVINDIVKKISKTEK